MRNAYRISIGKPEGMRSLGRPSDVVGKIILDRI
jgi:hypothetical protein